jgi:hypothetical protein
MFGGFAPLPLRLGGSTTNGLTAAQHARACADMVALVRRAELARIGLTTGSTAVSSYQALWETGVANAPTITAGVGWAKATWDAGFRDPFEVYQAISITGAEVGVAAIGGTTASYVINAPNAVTVYTWTHAGVAADGIPVFLVVR